MRRIVFTLALTAAALWLIAPAALAQADDQNCADFTSQASAQAHLRADPTDPDRLDGDNDGLACEVYPYPAGSARDENPVGHPPVTPGGGDQALPFTGPLPLLPQAGAAAALLTAGGLALFRTRHRARH